MEDVAGWIAPTATMIAAMMTAVNLGARVTGWGFVVFTIGSIAWSVVGLSSGQTNLLATNGFLTLVNLIGVWRWLGKQRAYEDGGKSATEASRRSAYPTLFTATGIAGMPVVDAGGETVGKAVEALVTCESGNVSYVVVASSGLGGIGEELRAVNRAQIDFACDRLNLRHPRAWFESLPPLAEGDWPAAPAELTRSDAR
ncbi:PRC-barrel domain-containing protein [Pseudomonas sp.]|uniref:PRC-barrel domain-containing protein n=1 Tax=Pseudomonas sp. TaxID=306 RepID=UPI0025ED1A36|nr:PRC-barrel domain-containing protein [Pseudomonas sp.]